MKVNNCRNCLFRISIFNDWSFGHDSADVCSLEANKKLIGISEPPSHGLIRQYNEYEESDSDSLPDIDIPEWCPLKMVDKVEISLFTE